MNIRNIIRIIENANKITHEVLSEVLRVEVKSWLLDGGVTSAEEISSGHCADFADGVWRLLGCPPDEILHFSSCYAHGSGHTWLTFQGKHYDAECAEGVSDWKQLPFWQRDALTPHPIINDPKADIFVPG